MKEIPPPTISEIPDRYNLFKCQFVYGDIGWLDINQHIKCFGFENRSGEKFYVLQSMVTIDQSDDKWVTMLNFMIDSDIRLKDAAQFANFFFDKVLTKTKMSLTSFAIICESSHQDALINVFEEKFSDSLAQNLKAYNRYLLVSPEKFFDIPILPEGYRCKPLHCDHAEHILPFTVKHLYLPSHLNILAVPRNKDKLLSIFISAVTSDRPTFGIFHLDEPDPVAWLMVSTIGTMGRVVVIDKHKGKGLDKHLLGVVVNEFQDKVGLPPVTIVHHDDKESLGFLLAQGFQRKPKNCVNMFFASKLKL